ncbi:MAG: hypothetical protein R6X13_05925 [bacterium]
MHRNIKWLAVVLAAAALGGCYKRVLLGPEVDLQTVEVVGIVEFAMDEQGSLAPYATRVFLEAITRDQPGIEIVELGREADVLRAVGEPAMTPEAIMAIGEKYGLRTVVTGTIDISEVTPRVQFGFGFPRLSASADVEATLTARLVQTSNAATIWTGAGTDEKTVGQVTIMEGFFSFDAENPERAYGELVKDLVYKSTRDFRRYWKCVRTR